MADADLNGCPISYSDHGGDGPVLIFSHGIFLDSGMFAPQVAGLRDVARCITWDQRGHGETALDSGYDYWTSADDLVALLDHLDVPSAVLVGMSQGGFIGLRAALRYPDRVAGLIFIDSQAGTENPDMIPAYDAMVEQWVTSGPSDDLAAMTASIILGEGVDPAPWIVAWQARPQGWVRAPYAALTGREDLSERLSEIDTPALVIHGTADMAIPIERARALCEGLPRCDGLIEVPNAGHAANLADPKTVNAAISDFLAKHAT